MICTAVMDQNMKHRIYRAREARQVSNATATVISHLIRDSAVKPVLGGEGTHGVENLFDDQGVFAIRCYTTIRAVGIPASVAQRAAKLVQETDMEEAAKTGAHFIVVGPEGILDGRPLTKVEAKSALGSLTDESIGRAIVIDLVPLWAQYREVVEALEKRAAK